MRLNINNIGIIKEADIALNGLTVIAGKNDSGKSTVSKVLYSMITTLEQVEYKLENLSHIEYSQYQSKFNKSIQDIFNNQISEDVNISFEYKDETIKVKLQRDRCTQFEIPNSYKLNDIATLGEFKVLMIETPYIWNIFPTLKSINNLSNTQIDFNIPTITSDLYFALNTKLKDSGREIALDIDSIIEGEFQDDDFGNFIFQKDDKRVELTNTAMGIKYFGILQVLANNNHFYKEQILILDEPEVHLHPTWQLELAKQIVHLVKNGVKILVNSHSPYMIEALELFAKKEKILSNFYFAKKEKDSAIITNVDNNLEVIYETLSDTFMELERIALRDNFKW